MTLQSSGNPISFNQIRGEFGNGTNRLGQYRRDDGSFGNKNNGDLTNMPLDTNIPTSGQIKFSDFYGKSLNVVVNYHSGSAENRPEHAHDRYSAASDSTGTSNGKWNVVGGYRNPPTNSGGTKVKIHVNKTIGSANDTNENICALRTGAEWSTGTMLSVDVGDSGKISGGGGNGGAAGGTSGDNGSPGGDGQEGTSGLGIQYGTDANETTVNLNSSGVIVCGFGGGGAGSGAEDTDDEGFLNFEDEDHVGSGGPGGGGAGVPAGSGGSTASGGNAAGSGSFDDGGSGGTGTGVGGNAVGGTGGRGGDVNDSALGGGNAAEGETSGAAGDPGGNGAAIRRTSNSIKWAFGVNDGTVTGSGAGGQGESPDGVS